MFLLEACRIAYVLYILYLKCFSRESDEKILFGLFVLSLTSTVRGFALGTVCKLMCMMMRISFKATHRMGL